MLADLSLERHDLSQEAVIISYVVHDCFVMLLAVSLQLTVHHLFGKIRSFSGPFKEVLV